MIDWNRSKWVVAIPIAIALGLLEAAWTGPGRGAPTNTWLGVLGIFIIFGFITFPKVWRIGLLSIIEEVVHSYVGYTWVGPYGLLPRLSDTVFNHWSYSQGFLPFNVYPYILFILITLIGELAVWWKHRLERKYQEWISSSPY